MYVFFLRMRALRLFSSGAIAASRMVKCTRVLSFASSSSSSSSSSSATSGWRARADSLAHQGRKMLEEERTSDAEDLFYASLRTHLQNSDLTREALDLMRHITILHLARFAAEELAEQLEKARKMQLFLEQGLEKIGDWSGLVEALVRRGRQNEGLFNQTQAEEHLQAAEEAFEVIFFSLCFLVFDFLFSKSLLCFWQRSTSWWARLQQCVGCIWRNG